jgi:hypothetical protein
LLFALLFLDIFNGTNYIDCRLDFFFLEIRKIVDVDMKSL